MENRQPVLELVFYKALSGTEPVRDWLKGLPPEDKKSIGEDIRTAQSGWPVGMPLIRKIETGLWEVRSRIRYGIARVLFTVIGNEMVLLHGFVKKSQATAQSDLVTAKDRRRRYHEQST